MSYATQHNLPIFSKKDVVSRNDRYYINATVGFETYLGVMNTSPRKDYFAVVNSFNGKDGKFKIGRLDLMDVSKKIKKDSILIEVIPNKYGNIVDFTEYSPKMKSGYLVFSTEEIKMTFFDWVKFIKL